MSSDAYQSAVDAVLKQALQDVLSVFYLRDRHNYATHLVGDKAEKRREQWVEVNGLLAGYNAALIALEHNQGGETVRFGERGKPSDQS